MVVTGEQVKKQEFKINYDTDSSLAHCSDEQLVVY